MLKGENKYETAENYSMLVLIIGSVMLALGILLNVVSTVGISAILCMFGALIAFIGTVSLIFVWLLKEFFGE